MVSSFFPVQSDEKVKDVLSKTRSNPRRRMLAVYDLCKGKKMCEASSLDNFQDENLPPDDTERMKKMVPSHACSCCIQLLGTLSLCSCCVTIFILPGM
jgi:hypothetical protein